ncbi:MAG TPA: GntR family transcriptional regulator [Casimicrobiaceae bacterium]|jgi:DNA-binding GntR family transcriptional regulator|nr:GntR family transcriptional regulator [Casimicrobiaceae bacterium]
MAATDSLRVIQTQPTLREMTADRLREAIFSMHFKPNERLVERDLCDQTGVSRTCVREALRHLESEGLVERRPNKGLYVTAITADEARQIYEVRGALEPMVARLFVKRASESEVKALRQTVAQTSAALNGKAVRAYVQGFDDFYDVLLRGSGNEVARKILQGLHARITYLRTLTANKAPLARKRETVALMRAIAEAAAQRDAKEVSRRCGDFVERSAAYTLQVLSDEPVPTIAQSG